MQIYQYPGAGTSIYWSNPASADEKRCHRRLPLHWRRRLPNPFLCWILNQETSYPGKLKFLVCFAYMIDFPHQPYSQKVKRSSWCPVHDVLFAPGWGSHRTVKCHNSNSGHQSVCLLLPNGVISTQKVIFSIFLRKNCQIIVKNKDGLGGQPMIDKSKKHPIWWAKASLTFLHLYLR